MGQSFFAKAYPFNAGLPNVHHTLVQGSIVELAAVQGRGMYSSALAADVGSHSRHTFTLSNALVAVLTLNSLLSVCFLPLPIGQCHQFSGELVKVNACLFCSPKRLLSVIPDIAEMFADDMDIRSICQWRATCRKNYEYASSSLRRTLTTRIRPFIPHPHQLVEAVTKYGAVFGGELALSFFLRNELYRPSHLEIFASNYQYNQLCETILDDPQVQAGMENHTFLTSTLFCALRRLVAESLVIHLINGKSIYVHQSYTSSPCAPISRSPCTALSNFVNGYAFGCSHPELTLGRRALLADRELLYLSLHDTQSMDRLLAHRFSLAVSPTAWPDYRRDINEGTLRTAEECWRERYICPNQGRYFGDKGSFVGFFDPLAGDEERCIKENIPPFGQMVIWHLMTSFQCDDGCEDVDEVLEPGVSSVPVLFSKDAFGDLRECISGQCMRSVPYYRTFGRPGLLSV